MRVALARKGRGESVAPRACDRDPPIALVQLVRVERLHLRDAVERLPLHPPRNLAAGDERGARREPRFCVDRDVGWKAWWHGDLGVQLT